MVFIHGGGNKPHFRSITHMEDDNPAQLVQQIADDVKNLCVRMGYLSDDGDIVQNPALDPLFQEDSALYQATVHSIVGKVAFVLRVGHSSQPKVARNTVGGTG
jgi:hypothetical protein